MNDTLVHENLRFIRRCPVGCTAPLAATAVVMPEGALLRCTECGQWISQASMSWPLPVARARGPSASVASLASV